MSRVNSALLLRDTIQKIVDDKLGKTNPGASYATVTGFNPVLGTITVRYPGDDVDIEIPAGSIYPSEPGQIVRIEGPPGSRVVADVKGENLTEVKARTAQETADGKNTVNYGDEKPKGADHKDGDIWFDEGNSNMPHVWKDGDWVSIEDLRVSAIAEAQDELKRDLDAVVENGVGTKTFYKPTEPTAAESKEGDLWFDTSAGGNNELHTFTGGVWVSAADARIAVIKAAQDTLRTDLAAVKTTADGKNKTYYQITKPSGTNYVTGDLWFDTSAAGKNAVSRWSGTTWVSAADSRIAEIKAAQDTLASEVSTVKATADGKNKTYYQVTKPSGTNYVTGDLWFDTSTSGKNAVSRWSGTEWVSASDARLAELKTAQDTMSGDITAAQQKADIAFQNAADADSKAVTAKSAADAAADAAASAAGIANGKGKVLVQSTAPGAADRNAQTLWIDTTGGANTPKRWVSGTTWSAVTDKAATDAASAAATAKSAADAAKSAADAAQATATNAQTAASNAQSTATEALTSANSKNTVTRSTSNPTTPYAGRVDDIWWKMSTLSSGGRVIAQYRWSGTAWLTETIDNAVIANLDAAKITTGYLAAARIQANTLNADTVLINGSLGSIILRDGAITTPKIAVGAITAESGVVASLDAGKITVGTIDSARIAANSITADKVLIGSDRNWIPNGDLRLGNVSGWPVPTTSGSTGPTYSTDAPQGMSGSVQYNTQQTQQGANFGRFSVVGVSKLTFSTWVKADKADSVIYVEVRDQNGNHLGRSGGYGWSGTEANQTYAISAMKVPTAWTKVTSTITLHPDVTDVYIGGMYFNHSAGTVRDATVSYAGLSLSPQIGSTLIEPGAITTEKIAAGAITAESGVIGSIDAGKITVGTLDSARIAANSITADKVLIGSGGNLLSGANFVNGGAGWGSTFSYSSGGKDGSTIATVPASTSTSGAYLGSISGFDPASHVKVTGGSSYTASVWVRSAVAIPASRAVIYCRTFTASDGQSNSYTWATPNSAYNQASVPANTWTLVTGTFKMPEGAVEATIGLYVTSSFNQAVDFCLPSFQQAVGSTLIEPGAITTEKIATGAITAQSGIIASLDAGKITVGTIAAARFAANTINADSILVNGSLGSTIIKDGAITTEKLAVGAITAESGVIGSIDASKITVGKLSGARLEADAINGMQIIGATIATSTGFPRVQLDSAGLAVYKSSAVRSFFADAATGDLDVVGNFRTGTSGPRVEIASSISGMVNWLEGETGIALMSGAGGSLSTTLRASRTAGTYGGGRDELSLGNFLKISTFWSVTGGGYTSEIASTAGWFEGTDINNRKGLRISDTGGVFVSAPTRINLTTDTARITLVGPTNTATVTADKFEVASSNFNVVPDGISEISSTNIRPINIVYSGTAASWLIPFSKGTTEWGYVGSSAAMSADDFGVQSAAGKAMVVSTTNSTDNLRVTNRRATLEMNSYTARFDIDNASGGRFQVPAIYNVTASGSANVVVNAQGTLFRPSSSLRYKRDIRDLSPNPSILDIETKTWRDKAAVDLSEQAHAYLAEIGQGPLPRELQEAELEPCRHFGAIAEEVDALGLSELVEYDHAGRPDALKYPMFGVALIPEVRKLRDRIDALEAMLDTPTETAPVE